MSTTSQLYSMIDNYITNTNIADSNSDTQQRVIKSYIKKTPEGIYCIYDNDFYINIIFGPDSNHSSQEIDYDGYILKTDKFHLDTLICRNPSTGNLVINVVLFVATFEIDFSKKLNKEFNPKNINYCKSLSDSLYQKATRLVDMKAIDGLNASLNNTPYSFLCGEQIPVFDLNQYFYQDNRQNKQENVGQVEEQLFESYEEFANENQELFFRLNQEDFQKFKIYYELKEIKKNHHHIDENH